MEADEKKCPQCAETVKAGVRICRYCGHDFQASTTSGAIESTSPEKKGSGLGKGCLIVAGILVALALIGSLVGPADPDQEFANAAVDTLADESLASSGGDQSANETTIGLTGPQANAVRTAQQYLAMTGFSREGLIEQLSSDAGSGYGVDDATAAVDSLSVDWNEQAARTAKQYLQMTGFSCSGLIEQLSSSAGSGYTESQARFGAEQAGAC